MQLITIDRGLGALLRGLSSPHDIFEGGVHTDTACIIIVSSTAPTVPKRKRRGPSEKQVKINRVFRGFLCLTQGL